MSQAERYLAVFSQKKAELSTKTVHTPIRTSPWWRKQGKKQAKSKEKWVKINDFDPKVAESVRFELTRRCRQTVFKTAAL